MSVNSVQDYGWDDAEAPDSCNYITPEILRILRDVAPSRVLDIGCGNGSLCSTIKKELGCYVAGIENDKRGVVIGRKSFPNISFYHYGIQDNPKELMSEENESFDVIISTEVIEHLFSPHLLPRYAHHVLTPGGRLVITTPYHGYLKNLVLAVLNKWDKHLTPLWEGGHIKFWSRNTLTTLLEQNGFKVTGFSGVGRLPYLWKSMVLVAEKVK